MDKERIDGFRSAFAVSDHYALEFMRFLQRQGIRVPEDVQIIGFDDTLASRESVPALTTIHQDAALRARTAIRRLEALRDGTPLRCRHSDRTVSGCGGAHRGVLLSAHGGQHRPVRMAALQGTRRCPLLNLLLILIGFAVCLQKEAERPLTVEIWTRWAGVLCLFSEYNGEPDLLFRLAQVKSAAIGDGHAQLIERTGGKLRYCFAVLVCDRPQCRIDLC